MQIVCIKRTTVEPLYASKIFDIESKKKRIPCILNRVIHMTKFRGGVLHIG